MMLTSSVTLLFELCLVYLLNVPTPTTASDVGPCYGECAGNWKQCGGSGFDGFSACCGKDFFCYSVNKYYSQCRRPNSVNTGWTGPFICGEDCADPTAVASIWGGYELSNNDLILASYQHEHETPCAEECDNLQECVAFQENEDGGSYCNLYGEGVISTDNIEQGTWMPNFDSVLNFVKCYRPPQLCPEDTIQEVDGTDPQLYELVNQDIALVYLTEEFAVGDCATICRMFQRWGVSCAGFALRGSTCYPLFDVQTSPNDMKEVELGGGTSVYSISDCLP